MKIRDRHPRGPRHVKPPLPGEQIAAETRLALQWRAEFRAETAGPPPRAALAETAAPKSQGDDETKRRIKFAKAIARVELGRNYWDERLQQGVARLVDGPSRPGRKKRE
jgi:hypothetical protein